jgi:hypothetical protein
LIQEIFGVEVPVAVIISPANNLVRGRNAEESKARPNAGGALPHLRALVSAFGSLF